MLASTSTSVSASIQCLLFAKISLDTPANLLDREFNSSSTTAESSAEAEVSVVVYGVMLVECGIPERGFEAYRVHGLAIIIWRT
jgi:hypothetical protein